MFGAVDIGGTKTLLAVFDKDGMIIRSVKLPTPNNYKNFKSLLTNHFQKTFGEKIFVTAVAVPGVIDRGKGVGIAFGNLPWENVTIRDDISHIFKCPVVVENDAKLAGLSEAALLKDYRKVLYVTLSTGIGGGFIVNGKIDPNLEDIEVGQMLLEHEGKLLRWEDFASGRAIFEQFGKAMSDITDKETLLIIAHNVAVGLIDLIATLTPDIIVIGGGVGAHFEKIQAAVEEDLKIYENDLLRVPPIIKAKRPEDAVIYGCFELAKNNYEKINN